MKSFFLYLPHMTSLAIHGPDSGSFLRDLPVLVFYSWTSWYGVKSPIKHYLETSVCPHPEQKYRWYNQLLQKGSVQGDILSRDK